MKIQDIKNPGFIEQAQLMGQKSDEGLGTVHISGESFFQTKLADVYVDKYGRYVQQVGNAWFVYDTAKGDWVEYNMNPKG